MLMFRWMTGHDGDVWVWVMGDHQNDRSIDDIIENETRQKARAIVEAELLKEKLNDSSEVSDTDEEQLKQQLRQMRLGTSSEESSSRSSANRQNEQPEIYNPKSTTNFINPAPYYSQVYPPTVNDTRPSLNGSDNSSFDSNGQNSFDEYESTNENNKKPPLIQKLFGKNNIFTDARNSTNANKSSPLPWRVSTPNKRSESPATQIKSNPTPATTSNKINESNGNSNSSDKNTHLVRSYDSKPTTLNGDSSNGNDNSNASHKSNNVIRPPPPVPARPAHLAKKPKDKGFVQVSHYINFTSYIIMCSGNKIICSWN